MAENKRYNFIKIFGTIIWILLGAGTVVLLIAAITKKNSRLCKAVVISISGVQNNYFIDKKDVLNLLEKMDNDKPEGRPVNSFNLSSIENTLQKNTWIKNAQVFFDNNDVLEINIREREPVARIFNVSGSSFYIDSFCTYLPLSDKFSARLPVFTNFPTAISDSSKTNNKLLAGIKNLSLFIENDPFWMAQIDQVDIAADNTFEMIPKIGNQVILFGDAEDITVKFHNLLVFYKEVGSKVGWNKYSKIDVQYKGQVVGVKRGVEDIKMDSLRARQIMQSIVANAQKLANDSVNNIQLVQPKDDNTLPPAPESTENMPGKNILSFSPPVKSDSSFVTKPVTAKAVTSKPVSQSVSSSTFKPVNKIKKLIPYHPISKSIERPIFNSLKKPVTKPPVKKPPDKTGKPKVAAPQNDY
ncbi:MAG: FtsQ-type POTRA domain-containing protein [Chitinophagaceae bacterium]|nr:FtsQ-type POTRA domain-containing protein [Chitinophagaceae bacterium]